ncbi:unnamed protein product [Gongylonema pulchrum]|uniref:Glyco_hydro_38C domain-containing protein n=1 Tax=Gongylonema pulchrum TaxID=637853 RepID=A0A183DSC3_9BILA|nr:unnamed protein product [Gongylonema pulchrum]
MRKWPFIDRVLFHDFGLRKIEARFWITEFKGRLVNFSTALFVLARQSSFMMGFVEWLRIDALPSSLTVLMLAQNFKILQGSVQRPFIHWNDPKAVKLCGSSDRLMMRLSQLPSSWEWLLLAESSVTLVWSTIAHIIMLETFRSLKRLFGTFTSKTVSKTSRMFHFNIETANPVTVEFQLPEEHVYVLETQSLKRLFGTFTSKTMSKTSRMFHFNIETANSVTVEFQLPEEHVMRWEAPSLHAQRSDHLTITLPQFTAFLDGHPILTIEKFRIQRRAFDSKMDLGRKEFNTLKNRTNKVWTWSANSLMFLFPYGYNFAAGYDEVW